MKSRRFRRAGIVGAITFSFIAPLLSQAVASASPHLTATATFPSTISNNVPLARLHFSNNVSARLMPSVNTFPRLVVSWQQIGPRDVQAVTRSQIVPATTYRVSVPTTIACSTTCTAVTRTVRNLSAVGSTLWLQELLATMKFLPVSFQPANRAWNFQAPAAGSFFWRFSSLPSSLRTQWSVGSPNLITKGAVMRFQNVSNLATTGVADSLTWHALIADAKAGFRNQAGYNYVDVATSLPQTLTLYANGQVVFHTLVNTGISQAPTELGTYPVYVRYLTTTMSGTNPDGSHYSDPGIPWVSYFHGGDALHGFIRSSYGWPQSLGCVEMRYDDAHVVFPYTPIGTLVTVR